MLSFYVTKLTGSLRGRHGTSQPSAIAHLLTILNSGNLLTLNGFWPLGITLASNWA